MQEIAPEFSRRLAIDDIARDGSVLALEATAEERRRLAERFGLLALDKLTVALTVTRADSGIPIRVQGRLSASVVQECVVSLEPVPSEINEIVDVEYAPMADDAEEEAFGVDDPDPAEPLEGDSLELGELVAQHLSLALDPYPRKEGSAAPEWAPDSAQADGNEAENPFAVLAELRKKGG